MSKLHAVRSNLTLAPVALTPPSTRVEMRPGELPWSLVTPDPSQPRKTFDQVSLLRLATSLREDGLLQPIRVRAPGEDGMHTIIAGERRWRAFGLAWPDEVERPAVSVVIVYDLGDEPAKRAFLTQLVENIEREELPREELASAVLRLHADFDLTRERIAERLHRSLSWVDEQLAFARLPAGTRQLLEERGLSTQLAKGLRALPPEQHQAAVEAIPEGSNRQQQHAALRVIRAGEPAQLGGSPPAVPPVRSAWEWRAVLGAGDVLAMRPANLALARLLTKPGAGPAEWRAALVEDLEAFRNACAAGGAAGAAEWSQLVDLVGPELR